MTLRTLSMAIPATAEVGLFALRGKPRVPENRAHPPSYEEEFRRVGKVTLRWDNAGLTIEVCREDEAVVGSVKVIVH